MSKKEELVRKVLILNESKDIASRTEAIKLTKKIISLNRKIRSSVVFL